MIPQDLIAKNDAHHYLLRPEVVESLYILNKLTGDPVYREWGWEIFQSVEKYCKTEYGYAAHPDVTNVDATLNDSMESFFLAETLKYLYLLMDPDSEVDLDKVSSFSILKFVSFVFWHQPSTACRSLMLFCCCLQHVFTTEAHPLRKFNLS